MTDPTIPSGRTTIAPDVLTTIARLTALNVPGVSRMFVAPAGGVNRLLRRAQVNEGVVIDVEDDTVYADLYVVIKNDVSIQEVGRVIQHQVARAISEMVGMQVGRVNIHVEDIDYPQEAEG